VLGTVPACQVPYSISGRYAIKKKYRRIPPQREPRGDAKKASRRLRPNSIRKALSCERQHADLAAAFMAKQWDTRILEKQQSHKLRDYDDDFQGSFRAELVKGKPSSTSDPAAYDLQISLRDEEGLWSPSKWTRWGSITVRGCIPASNSRSERLFLGPQRVHRCTTGGPYGYNPVS